LYDEVVFTLRHLLLSYSDLRILISVIFALLWVQSVVCRGGANGATAQGIQGRGHPRSEITKNKML